MFCKWIGKRFNKGVGKKFDKFVSDDDDNVRPALIGIEFFILTIVVSLYTLAMAVQIPIQIVDYVKIRDNYNHMPQTTCTYTSFQINQTKCLCSNCLGDFNNCYDVYVEFIYRVSGSDKVGKYLAYNNTAFNENENVYQIVSNEFAPGKTTECFYDPDNIAIIYFDVDDGHDKLRVILGLTIGTVALFGILLIEVFLSIFFINTLCMICFCFVCIWKLVRCYYRRLKNKPAINRDDLIESNEL